MPKELTDVPPTSSIASILDRGVTQAATTTQPSKPSPTPAPVVAGRIGRDKVGDGSPGSPADVPAGEPADIVRQFQHTETTDGIFQTLHMAICKATKARGLSMAATHRAIMLALGNAMDSLEREVKHIGPVKVPKNAKGYEAERDDIEKRIAVAIVAGMRAAPALNNREEEGRPLAK